MKKKLLYGLLLPLFAVVLVSAAILFATIPVTFSVGEALSTTTTSLDFSGVVSECITESIDVENIANNDLPVQLTWVETSNENGVTYTIDVPRTEILNNGANTIDVTLCYADGSVIGSVSGDLILSRGSGENSAVASFTQKDLTTWIPHGITANIIYSTKGETFTVSGIPEGYTLIYYPNTVGDNFATNVANVIVLTEGSNSIDSLPLGIDVGDDYCTNGFNPDAEVCDGAKLWLILGNEAEALAKLNSWDMDDTLFETDLITYTNTG